MINIALPKGRLGEKVYAMFEKSFSALLASAIDISRTGSSAPTSATEGSSGQLYFDLANKNVYVCTAESPAFAWRRLQLTTKSRS